MEMTDQSLQKKLTTQNINQYIQGIMKEAGVTDEQMSAWARDRHQEDMQKMREAYIAKLNAEKPERSWDFNTWKDFVARNFVNNTGKALIVDDYNRTVMSALFLYFFGATEDFIDFASAHFSVGLYSSNKGILILGQPGCGKTSILRAMMQNPYRSFGVVSAIEIAQKYHSSGYDSVQKFFDLTIPQVNMFNQERIGWCFDDLGAERETSHYGDKSMIMEEILFKHSNENNVGMIHATSNLNIESLKERYGPRIASRLYELFNVIYFEKSIDRRR